MDTGQDAEHQQQQRNLNAKYQKLATEYAKLRSQVQVLKKAVVEEQQQTTQLKETLTSQDQCIRKLEQELDSVKFRNRQLEKRIEILQEHDAASNNASGTTASQSSYNQSSSSSSFDSNVLLHVEQNKQLQESLALLNEKYNVEVSRLKRMIDHEMVPRELLDSLKQEHNERIGLLNKRVKELCNVNSELMDKVSSFELEKTERYSSGSGGTGGGGNQDGVQMGHAELVLKLAQAEVDKEKLNSEVQILRLKLKRYYNNEDSGSIKSPSSNDVAGLLLMGTSYTGSSPVVETTTIIGKCEVNDDQINNDHELVIRTLHERVEELVRLLQLSDSKAVYYYHEAHNLCRLVRTSQLAYRRLDGEFNKLKVKYRGVQDELDDIKGGYEGQVNSLTEHIAILNEKLATMVEEMSVIKKK